MNNRELYKIGLNSKKFSPEVGQLFTENNLYKLQMTPFIIDLLKINEKYLDKLEYGYNCVVYKDDLFIAIGCFDKDINSQCIFITPCPWGEDDLVCVSTSKLNELDLIKAINKLDNLKSFL